MIRDSFKFVFLLSALLRFNNVIYYDSYGGKQTVGFGNIEKKGAKKQQTTFFSTSALVNLFRRCCFVDSTYLMK